MGPYLSKPIKKKKTQSGENDKVRYACSEMQGWRTTMEDTKITNLTLDESTMIFAVFDGHGGREMSEFASRHLTFTLLSSPTYETNLTEALIWTFSHIDDLARSPEGRKEMYRISKNLPSNHPVGDIKPSKKSVGCTALVAVVRRSEIYVANAGDSRCVINRGGLAIDLSVDHKPSLMNERQRILEAGGIIEDGRINGGLNLTRSLGDFPYKDIKGLPANKQLIISEPEITVTNIEKEDRFMVLACDGIWEKTSSQGCVEFIDQRIERKPLTSITEEIEDQLIAPKVSCGIGCDNMTIIIVAFKQPFD